MTHSGKLMKIRAVVLDVDGVLTDGRAGFGGEEEIKFFHLRDGHWMKLAMRAGLKVGLLSGRGAKANRLRAAELGLTFIYENCKDKLEAFERMLSEQQLAAEECLYMGDDVIDLPPMRRAGAGVVVADGVPELDEAALWRTETPGGHGAVAEVVRILLAEQGKLDAVLERYRR
ncbi:MAG: HAD hydrolase family protein [Lentisphaeria bacterium]|nr:HAD hydrolase family protein [Lentisphaeria bacterium]